MSYKIQPYLPCADGYVVYEGEEKVYDLHSSDSGGESLIYQPRIVVVSVYRRFLHDVVSHTNISLTTRATK
jgi:hypothetical protein